MAHEAADVHLAAGAGERAVGQAGASRRRRRLGRAAAVTVTLGVAGLAVPLSRLDDGTNDSVGTTTPPATSGLTLGCQHRYPTGPVVDDPRLGRVSDAYQHLGFGLVAPRGRGKPQGPPPAPDGLSAGFVGVITEIPNGFTLIVDPRVHSTQDISQSLLNALGPRDAALVVVEPSCVSSAELITDWEAARALMAQQNVTHEYSMSFDAAREMIELGVKQPALGPLRDAVAERGLQRVAVVVKPLARRM